MVRRKLLSQLACLPFFALGAKTTGTIEDFKTPQNHDEKCVGIGRPNEGLFRVRPRLALADAGHDVQIFLTGEATYLMRKVTANAVTPVGWPPLSETLRKIVAKHIPIFS